MVVGPCDRGSSYHQASGSREQDRKEQGITRPQEPLFSDSCLAGALLSEFPEPPQTE